MRQTHTIEIGATPQSTLRLARKHDDNPPLLLKSIAIEHEGTDAILYCELQGEGLGSQGFTIALPYGNWIELAHAILGALAPSVEHQILHTLQSIESQIGMLDR